MLLLFENPQEISKKDNNSIKAGKRYEQLIHKLWSSPNFLIIWEMQI